MYDVDMLVVGKIVAHFSYFITATWSVAGCSGVAIVNIFVSKLFLCTALHLSVQICLYRLFDILWYKVTRVFELMLLVVDRLLEIRSCNLRRLVTLFDV